MAVLARGNNGWFPRLKALAELQRFNHTAANGVLQGKVPAENADSVAQGLIDISKWKKIDSRLLGITQSRISPPALTVMKILGGKGFAAYLVGGCVRDLILSKVPKDFDVITTAKLKQIHRIFKRTKIVGQRFPICMVHIKGSQIEVSSFETVAQHAEDKRDIILSQIPHGCDKKDFIRWRNSMHRDFTINSLFYDPFENIIYDYANGMADIRSLKLQTLIPAQLSFKEDCARILRGLRIGARLGLTFSKDIETAICNLSSSIKTLAKARIMMELNYMLSYGAAEPSLLLLWRFNLLEMILPFHAAYLDQQASKKSELSSMMLMKLFFNMDRVVTCDRPSNCILWVGLLAFHLALVNNPQDALVVQAFASVLYHGNGVAGVKFARECAKEQINFVPEISGSSKFKTDEELTKEINQLAILAQESLAALTEPDSICGSMPRYPAFECSGLAFIPRKTASSVAQIFKELENDIKLYKKGRKKNIIHYDWLGKGVFREIRFVLGKVILETMIGVQEEQGFPGKERNQLYEFENEQKLAVSEEDCNLKLSDFIKQQLVSEKDRQHSLSQSNPKVEENRAKRQKLVKKQSVLEHHIDQKKQVVVEKHLEVMEGKHHKLRYEELESF